MVRRLDQCDAFAQSVVTSVAAAGCDVFATEFLGSVTVLRVVATSGGGVALQPLSADRCGRWGKCGGGTACGRAT
eukprot:2613-Chlamydomonas_euryale.AAC.1